MRALCTLGFALLIGSISWADEPKKKTAATVDKKSQAEETTDQADEKKPVSFWMEKKLQYSQEMLAGLVTGDLEDIAVKAEQMRFLSKVEGWVRKGKTGYKEQLQAFDFANAEIERYAKAKNLEGATMAFQQLTISCVSCHALLRNPQ